MTQLLQPKNWRPTKGFTNGVAAQGRQIFVAGQIGWNAQHEIVSDDFTAQVEQALQNVVAILAEAQALPEDLVRLTWFVVDKHEYIRHASAIGSAYRRVIGRHYPAMTLVQVAALLEDRARVEIEATAIVEKERGKKKKVKGKGKS